ncbi:MAG: class I SAM-dependent methyltransferase [Kaiparowitsia implicata GSE-PSE-MK54-09C]|jgi:ubiquinone/menaquinone biosynthesis C-methylase UbiE|nr:class I SAM-dependent methyltransferase [Kaiparowitsia implicata GSE-PSE-MK54-09C]
MWNHNTHYHSYLLRQIPVKVSRALDVGCGLGLFAWKLAERSEFVDALDVNSAILTEASNHNPAPNITYRQADFLKSDLSEAAYDVIVSIAALHHMDMEAALKKMKVLLRSSGKLLILGLYQEATLADYVYSAISVPLNLAYLTWYRTSTTLPTPAAPTCPAQLSFKQIKSVANGVVPGFRLQRHLFWRYSLIWQKP